MRSTKTMPFALALVAGCTVPTDIRVDSGAGDGSTDIVDDRSAVDVSQSDALADGGFDVVDGSIDDTGVGDTGIGDTGIGDTGVSPTCVACPVENVCSGSTCESVGTPVAIAPAAHAIVAARFPRILFSAGATSDRTRVDFCRDPACAMIDGSATVMHATGAASASFVPMFDPFSDGRRRFWRVVAGNARGFAQRGTTPRAIHRTGPGSTRASLQGWVAGYAQDFNNDGSSDLAASSGGSIDRFRTQPGGWYVFAGQASGASLVSPSPTTAGGVSIMPLHPPPGAPFGLRSYGDVNGDGFTDCSWSAHTGLESGTTIGVRGGIELFHGGPAPLTASAARFYGVGDHDYHVEAAAIGDVNGDGFNDALIGAAGDPQPGLLVRGRSVLYLGSASGLASSGVMLSDTAAWAWKPFYTGDLDNDGLSEAGLGFGHVAPKSLRIYRGSRTSPLAVEAPRLAAVDAVNDDQFGQAMVVGDLDDDGLLDLVAAGRRNTRIYVFSQTAAQSLTFATTPRYTLTRPSVANGPWAASMDALGDVNNDGLADFIVSASGAGAGAAIVYLGRPSMAPREVSIDVPAADRRTALAYNNSVAGLTDFNGDGTYEFALGVPNAGQTANNTGYVYIFGWDAGTSTFVVRQRVDISTYVSGGAADIFFGMGMR